MRISWVCIVIGIFLQGSVCWTTSSLRRKACVFVVTAATGFLDPLANSAAHIAHANPKGKEYERLRKAREELASLDEDFMDVVKTKGGDGVRSRLGTVYKPPACELSLCSFPIFVEKLISSDPDIDLDAIEEPARQLSTAYTQSDFYAYSSNFAEFGNGGGLYGSSPNSDLYLDKSREQVHRALKHLDEVLKILNQ